MPIQFFFADTFITLTNRKKLKQFIEQLVVSEKKKLVSLSIIFCSDDYLLSINRQFLQHDYYTDIITFNLAEGKEKIEGEIYISIDRIRDNSLTIRISNNYEVHRIIFHGVLHLCGYNDKSATQKKAMTAMEDRCLLNYFS